MKKYVIIPGCSDLNRGDQALVWETKRLAEENGFSGKFYLTAEENEPVEQSKKQGIHIIKPIMEHPSRVFKNKSNIHYNMSLKLKWGFVSIFDFLGSLFYLSKPTRAIAKVFMSREKKKALKVMEAADAVFVKGGGLFQTYGGLSSTYSMYFWCFHIFLAKALKKPIYIMPNSFGPFEGPLVKKIAKKAFDCCTFVTARESYSADMVKRDLGIDLPVYPDLAFGLQESALDRTQIMEKYNLPSDRPLVAMTMRPYRFPKSENPQKAYITFKKEMAKYIKWLYASGYMPVIVEHTLAVNAHENDGECIREVTQMLNEEEYRFVSNKTYNCYDLKAIYKMCDYIVGTRFHSVIFSLSSGVPGMAICYVGNKAQGIMHDIGLDDYAISIYDVNAELLKKKFEQLVANRDEVVHKITSYNNEVGIQHGSLMKQCSDLQNK